MKKALLAILTVFSLTFLSVPALAQSNPNDPLGRACNTVPGVQESSTCQASDKNPITGPEGILTKATQVVAFVVGIAAVFMIIIGGLRFVTASGDPKNVEGAKNTIMFAVIGLVIAVIAQGIVLFVLKQL